MTRATYAFNESCEQPGRQPDKSNKARFWELSGELLGILDAEGNVVHANPCWESFAEIHAGETSASFADGLHWEDRALALANLEDLQVDGSPTEFEARLRSGDGSYRCVLWKASRFGEEVYLAGRDVTEQREGEQAISDAYQKLTFYMTNSPLAFVEWDRNLCISYWSPETENVFGWSVDEAMDKRPQDWRFLLEEDADDFLGVMAGLDADADHPQASHCRHYRKDGTLVHCEWYHSALRDENGEIVSIFSLCLDVTERKRTEGELLKIRKAVESASDGICITDADGDVIHVNRAFVELFGYSLHELKRGGVETLFPEKGAAREVAAAVGAGLPWKGETGLLSQSEGVVPVLLRMSAIRSEQGKHIGCIAVCTDLRERKQAEQELLHQAQHDALTGLPNRSYFTQRLERTFVHSQYSSFKLGCIFIDLDNFKVINDSLGHEAGDDLLKAVAQRLEACIRPEDMVARLGGDEFVILLEAMESVQDAEGVAERVSGQLKQPVWLAGREVFVTASLGIALRQPDHQQASELLRDADVAMYQAKKGGKASYALFNASMNVEAMDRLELEMDLRRAIERGELQVYYQPIVHLASGKLTEAEALLRWQHPVRGFVSPTKFIPIAEETGLIAHIGEWVLEQACLRTREWHARFPSDTPLTISVNLSTRQLLLDNIVDTVQGILKKTGLDPQCLKLEITESVMMLDSAVTIAKLHAFKALGIRLAVDDFGTGYSSMAYLSSLPVDTLKIDRAFISRLGTKTEDDAIVRAIMTIARTMGLYVTAEGIETSEQMAELTTLMCDRGQGYFFNRPLTAADLEQLLDKTANENKTVEGSQANPICSDEWRRAA